MVKKIVLSVFVVAFIGCGDESKEGTKTESVSTDKAPTIEIVANENAKEIKVKQKDSNGSEGTFYQGMTGGLKHGYDPNSQPANKDAAVRVKPRTEVDANMHVRSPYEQVQVSLIVDDLSKNFRVKCSACHSDYANGIIGPSLLAKNSDEIFNAIADFKSGKKSNPLMDGLIDHMEESEIRELADEIYKFNQKIKEMRSK
jgi:cytochrome c553